MKTTKNGYLLLCRPWYIKDSNIKVAWIKRNTSFMPYVVAWDYDDTTDTWGQGHYFNSIDELSNYCISHYKFDINR